MFSSENNNFLSLNINYTLFDEIFSGKQKQLFSYIIMPCPLSLQLSDTLRTTNKFHRE